MKKKGNWKIEKSTTVFKNPWVKVINEKGVRPDGKKGEHALILYKPGVAVLPLDDEGNIYLNVEYRYAINSLSIEVVSGGRDDGDTDLQAAKKELKEELGIEAESFEDLGIFNPLTEVISAPNRLFIATKLSFTPSKNEATESIKMLKMPLKEAVRKVLKGEIHFSLAGLLILIAWEKYGAKFK